MHLHLPWQRHPIEASTEAQDDLDRTKRLRATVDSKWPDLLERSGLAQERLARNHIGESLDYTLGIRGE